MEAGAGAVNPVETCANCGAAAPLLFVAWDRNRRTTAERFPYYRCGACTLIFCSPLPEDLGVYYGGDYYGGPPSVKRLETAARLERYKIELVQTFSRAGRLVEVGPSYGAFALLAKRAGFAVEAIELDPQCCAFLRDVVEIGATCSDDPAVTLADVAGRYDVVAMWHNLEHVPQPHRLFVAAARALRPGGIMVVAMPNPEALQFRLFGRSWTHLDAPRHVALISRSLVERWAREHGLSVELMTTTDRGSLGWNEFGWRETLAATVRNRWLRLMLRIAGTFVTVAAMPFERTGFRGATYTAVLRRTASVSQS